MPLILTIILEQSIIMTNREDEQNIKYNIEEE